MKVKQQRDYSKFQYLNCLVKDHEDQLMNLICIQKGCKSNGLICSLCKQEHKNHRIIPIKHLVANLKDNINAPPDENIYCAKLQELENLKQGMFYSLKCCVQNLAQQFRELELDILNSYNKIKNEIIQQIQLGMQFDDLMAYAMTVNSVLKQEEYIQIFKKISKRINYNEKEINFAYDFTNIMIPFIEKEKKLLFNLKQIEDNVSIKIKDIKKQVKQIKVKEKEKEKDKEISSVLLKYRFSSTYKPSNITLNQQKTIAKQTTSATSRIIVIEEGMGLKNKKIMFRIPQLKNWIGLGVCIRDKIASVNYGFKYESLGHGSYLLSNNGYSWSHSRKEDNINPCGYKFVQDDKIEVKLTETQLLFIVHEKQGKEREAFKLNIQFKQTEWPQVCFCANLCSPDDTVQILDE